LWILSNPGALSVGSLANLDLIKPPLALPSRSLLLLISLKVKVKGKGEVLVYDLFLLVTSTLMETSDWVPFPPHSIAVASKSPSSWEGGEESILVP
jgi:hypothetical protein